MSSKGSTLPQQGDEESGIGLLPMHEPGGQEAQREKQPFGASSASASASTSAPLSPSPSAPHMHHSHHHHAPTNPSGRDKIKCLDGLRGIACLLVYNYHFLWPWTPYIMLGYGAAPPGSVEPYRAWTSLPIICLFQRGRPMVAIFFAISGYVVCRHILRAIHERRLDDAYRSLASASIRRVFRLYIPPTVSMFLVAMLAQMGAFRSEDDIYKGPDSVHINGTSTLMELGGPCVRGVTSVNGTQGFAEFLGLRNDDYLASLTGWNESFCANSSSKLFGPAKVYDLVEQSNNQIGRMTNETRGLETHALQVYVQDGIHDYDHLYDPYNGPVPRGISGPNATTCTKFKFVQMGGMWEEHPLIHDNATYALQNFTRTYVEWTNPFNFGHYHPRYDPHAFTIPMELRGSMVLYLFLLATAAIKAQWRTGLAGGLIAYSLTLGRWDVAGFLGGMTASELDIRHSFHPWYSDNAPSGPRRNRGPGDASNERYLTLGRWVVMFVALYFLSYPDAAAEYTPGFKFLSWWVPRYYIPLSGWMFYQSLGAVMLLPCVLREPILRQALEGRIPQLLGKLSFSLYLVHGPVLHSLGFWIMPRLFDLCGRPVGYAIGWSSMLVITLYLSHLWHKHIDVWSATVGRKVENYLRE